MILDKLPSLDKVLTDWTDCTVVESVPGKVSGTPILKGTRMPAYAVVENYLSGSSIEDIADNFEIPEGSVRAVLSYALARYPVLTL